MKVIDPGYTYELEPMEGTEFTQQLQFVKTVRDEEGEGRDFVIGGTTNEDVLDALIHRIKYQNGLLGCRETSLAITKLEEAKHWLEHRARDREQRGVTGTDNP